MSGRNGYNKSIMDTEDGECFICSYIGDTARHEVYPGVNRQICKKQGFWVALCPRCHDRVHQDAEFAYRWLKHPCYMTYCKSHSKSEFYNLIGAYYE